MTTRDLAEGVKSKGVTTCSLIEPSGKNHEKGCRSESISTVTRIRGKRTQQGKRPIVGDVDILEFSWVENSGEMN